MITRADFILTGAENNRVFIPSLADLTSSEHPRTYLLRSAHNMDCTPNSLNEARPDASAYHLQWSNSPLNSRVVTDYIILRNGEGPAYVEQTWHAASADHYTLSGIDYIPSGYVVSSETSSPARAWGNYASQPAEVAAVGDHRRTLHLTQPAVSVGVYTPHVPSIIAQPDQISGNSFSSLSFWSGSPTEAPTDITHSAYPRYPTTPFSSSDLSEPPSSPISTPFSQLPSREQSPTPVPSAVLAEFWGMPAPVSVSDAPPSVHVFRVTEEGLVPVNEGADAHLAPWLLEDGYDETEPPSEHDDEVPKSKRTRRDRVYQCKECRKWFDRPSALDTHKNAHSGAQRECPRIFYEIPHGYLVATFFTHLFSW
jgi:hypothetical protein